MDENIVRYTLRTERELFKKFGYVCKCNRRSINKQIEKYMSESVEDYEQSRGEILTR